MKVTRKPPDLNKIFAEEQPGNGDGKDREIAPSLFLQGLSKPIEGLDKGDFHAHIKGKCRSHVCRNKDGKETHDYDLDVHDFEPHGKDVKQKKSSRDEVDEAFKKYDKEEEEKKKPEKAEKK